MRRGIVWIALGLCSLYGGCEDLRQFKTNPDEVYVGEVIGSDADSNASSFIRKGFASHTQLELRFDPSASGGIVQDNDAGAAKRVPGTVNTYVCPDGRADCDVNQRTPGPFVHAQLVAIENLAHDALSQYTFPGGGRLRNYIFGLRFSSPTEQGNVDRDAMLFVSLMETERIEVRAIAPSVLAADGTTERAPALFGVFSLARTHL